MAANPPLKIPPFDPSEHAWVQSRGKAYIWTRSPLAAEKQWIHEPVPKRELFFGGTLKLSSPTSFSQIQSAVEETWRRLRFEHPEIALHTTTKAQFEYRVPRSEDEITEWTKRTLAVHEIKRGEVFSFDFAQAREAIGRRREQLALSESGAPELIFLDFYAGTAREEAGFMFLGDHLVTDGVGIRILARCFLRVLARVLGELVPGSKLELDWKQNAKHLPPPWTELWNGAQKMSGRGFEEGVQSQIELSRAEKENTCGLKVDTGATGMHQCLFHDFSREESAAILQAVKEKLGQSYNVTMLGHAATLVAMLKHNPPAGSKPQRPFVSPVYVNGRRYLQPDTLAAKEYIPLCRAWAAAVPHHVEELVPKSETEEERMKVLLKACAEIKDSYQEIRDRDSLLSESLPIPEWYHDSVFGNLPDQKKETAHPYFLSDGVIEQYIDRVYYAGTGFGRREIFSAEDVRFAPKADGPSLMIRLCSWRDSMQLSAEWNGGLYRDENARAFLEDVRALILSLVSMS